MTYSEIKSHFNAIFGTSTYITDSMLLSWANSAVAELVADTGCLEKRQKIVLTAGTQLYDFPDDCDKIRRAAYDGEKLPAESKWALQQHTKGWDSDSGTPKCYFVDGLNEQIGLYPIQTADTLTQGTTTATYGMMLPTDGSFGVRIDRTVGDRLEDSYGGVYAEVVGLDLEIYYRALAPAMTEDDHVPALPHWAHPLVLYYMLKMAYGCHSPVRDVQKSSLWAEIYRNGKYRLKVRTGGRNPKEWLLRTTGRKVRSLKVGRLPDVIDV